MLNFIDSVHIECLRRFFIGDVLMNNITLQDLLNKLKEYNAEEIEIVRRAYNYADNLHSGQKRQSGVHI